MITKGPWVCYRYCDLMKGLSGGIDCFQGARQFIEDVKAIGVKFGLIPGKRPTICDCIFAVKGCATFTNDCF